MSEPRIKSWLDIAPAYLDFAIKFLRRPPKAFASLGLDGRVSSDLTGILLGGVALSYVEVLIAGPDAFARDQGTVTQLVRDLSGRDTMLLPAVVMLGTLVAGVTAHMFGKVCSLLSGGRGAGFTGTMEDSVNSTLGFAGVYVPLATGVVCCLPHLSSGIALPVGVGLSVLLALFLCVYLPWSFSAMHAGVSWGSAALALGTGVVVIYLVVALVT